jgi:MFS family permease
VPLANIATLSRPPVLMTNVVTVLVGIGMFGAFVIVPQLVQAPSSTGYGFSADATEAGLLIVPGALMMLVVGPLSGRVGARLGSRIPLALGSLIVAVGMGAMGFVHDSELQILVFTCHPERYGGLKNAAEFDLQALKSASLPAPQA